MPVGALFRARAARYAAAFVFVLFGGVGFLPLFGGPGYEAALAAGVILPATAAVAVALHVRFGEFEAFDSLARGLFLGAALGLVALVTALLHGLRVGFCDLLGGSVLFGLGPMAGALMGGAWGAAAGVVTAGEGRRKVLWPLLLALCGPLAGVLVSLWRFASSPMVFAFDPFFGYFSGPLYDTVFDPVPLLVTYRAGSLATLAAGAVLAFHLQGRGATLRVCWRARPGTALLGALCAVASLGLIAAGPTLGHFSTPQSVLEVLERRTESARCVVDYDPSIRKLDAEALAQECSAHVEQIESYLETRGPARIRVLLFANDAQKGRLMGAARTYIAKPWREEIYIQFRRYPHPVLGHELAHVIAGSFGAGPFRVSGPVFGLLPDPGRIEGLAMAAAPDEDEDLSLQQWARAMQQASLLPPLSRVFRLSFLGENSSKAYTVAGAFVDWFHGRFGARALRDWYHGASLRAVTGHELAELEAQWHESLSKVTLDERAQLAARARFDQPSVFGRRCPHEVDALAGSAYGRLRAGDPAGAREDFEQLLRLDPNNLGARRGLASCSLAAGDGKDARARLEALSKDDRLHVLERLSAVEALGDIALSAGRLDDARARYRAVLERTANTDQRRTLDVKAYSPSAAATRAIVALLVGDPSYGADFGEAASWLGRWSTLDPEDGTADYLLGKNLWNNGRPKAARGRLDAALARPIPLRSVKAEALRMGGVLACYSGDVSRARGLVAAYLDDASVPEARRSGYRRFAQRCGALPETKERH
ncbi:MAG: tetratricopeptide repeat protein [Polyangiaceae bacterium]